MLPTPNAFALVSGGADASYNLSAFDAALLRAGVGDVNLVKVSSILPPGARFLERVSLPAGALVPIAYGAIQSSEPGTRLAAAVAVGVHTWDEPGVIVEYSLAGTAAEAESTVREMVRELFAARKRPGPRELLVASAEHEVRRVGCAFAGVVLWYV